MKITIIAACDRNWGIGKENELPWHIPADLKHFKKRTMGSFLIMGRKTIEGLPNVLPGRTIVPISRNPRDGSTVEEALDYVRKRGVEEVIIAGGAQIYEQTLDHATAAEITRIDGVFDCDTFMPNLAACGWEMHELEEIDLNLKIEKWRKQ